MDISNKTIWITGASSGIGKALTHQLSQLNTKIIISSRNIDELEKVKNICKTRENIFIKPLDLENHEEIKQVAKEVIKTFGPIDILINNGGISQRSFAKDTALEIDKKIMDINFFGTICLTKEVLQHMLTNKSGHIVVMSSLMGKFGAPLRSAYAASKHALHGFFDTLRAEIWKENIFISIICPGYVRTNISVNAITASGEPQKSMDKATNTGMDPEKLAIKIINAIKKRKKEVVIGGIEILGVYLNRFVPRFFSKIIRKTKVN